MKKLKHWIEHLPDVGRAMKRRAISIKTLHEEIKEKLRDIAYIQKRIREEEAEAEKVAFEDWDSQQIIAAKTEGDDLNHVIINRDEFMTFFRSKDFQRKMTADDCVEIFRTVLKGSSDVTANLLNEICADYSVNNITIYEND